MPKIPIATLKQRFETGDRPNGEDFVNLIDTLIAQATDLGSSGNNEVQISGIENVTIIDSVNTNQWRFVKYLISISKISGGENKFYVTELSILIDKADINVSEYGTIDNDGDLGTVSVSRIGSVLNILVTPNPGISPITVRFARIGLKA
jgi:hypothetical protein